MAGPQRAARVGAYVEEHLGGLMGNFLFGCMLGTAGIVGIILGLPIDIRHVAFSSANRGHAWPAVQGCAAELFRRAASRRTRDHAPRPCRGAGRRRELAASRYLCSSAGCVVSTVAPPREARSPRRRQRSSTASRYE
jgi:hypothetical protein